MKYLIVIDCEKTVFTAYSKTLRSAKCKITRFKKSYPYTILDTAVYLNHQKVYGE